MGTARTQGRGERGTALITALIMLAIMALFLVGFQQLNMNELAFAGYSRDSSLAFDAAEAGAQEGIKRLNLFGGIPGTTCFTNSMTSGATCGGSTSSPNANTVVYQATLSSNSAIFPILSLATTYGAPRGVRVYIRATLKSGFGDTIVGPQVQFQGDASPIIGDTYADTSISFASYAKAPPPGSGATATNLTGPQVIGGTWINAGNGNGEVGSYTYECGNSSTAEVAPTACAGQGGRAVDGQGHTLPVNWHPLTPVGMTTSDFATVVTRCYPSCSAYGITVKQATQSGTGVSYTPVSYTPSYWSTTGSGKVLVAVATQPFCVTGNAVTAPSGGSCGSGHYYAPNTSASQPMRYLDWGLVQDDLTRGAAQTFFQSPACASPCANAGNQNGVRYVPLLPSISVASLACQQNVDPGTNVFDQVNTADGISCSSPITTIDATTVTFSGTKSSPESLVIDNAGQGVVHINASVPGNNSLNCSTTNFNNYNWGVIFATGDIDITANTVFTGFIYTPGNVYSHGNVLIQGGIFSQNDPSSGAQVNEVDDLGTVNFCGGSNTQVILNPKFYTFSTVSWQDRPLGKP
jgi:hypothetical protein